MIVRPLEGRDEGIYWYILQTYSAAKIAFKRYVRLIQNTELFISKNRSELCVTLCNGAIIYFKSGRNYEDLRAETLDGCVIDELRQQHADLWPVVIRPMLGRRGGWCYFLTTTNGFDHVKDLVDFAEQHPRLWSVFHAPSTEAWWWTEEEIAQARATMTDDVFAQEIMAEFREIGVGKVYKSHGKHNQVIQNPFAVRGFELSPYLPVTVGLDFNVGLMVWELGQRQGTRMHFFDEIAVENTNSFECAQILAEKVKNHKPGVILVGDSSGNARKTSAVGETDYLLIKKVLKDAGIKYEDRTPKENPFVKDRVNAFNSGLMAADESVNITYNPKNCKHLKKDLERCKWKKGADGAFIDKSDVELTHASDAAGYPVAVYMNIFRERAGTLHVIAR